MKQRKAIRVSVNQRPQDVFLAFFDRSFIISTYEEADACFSWQCFDRADDWLSSQPGDDESRIFRDTPGFAEGEIPNALMIWRMGHRIFFGYDTSYGFWGGPMSRENFREIWEEIRNGRNLEIP